MSPETDGARIGLRRGTVRLVPYTHVWAEFFVKEAERLRQKISHLVVDIQHVGSTAVPGLSAKPIIDIAIAVESKDVIAPLAQDMGELGYIDRGDGGDDGGYLFVLEREPEVSTVHIHVVEAMDIQWQNYIGFRELLRKHEEIRERYGMLKRRLAREFKCDRASYTEGKHEFIRRHVDAG